MKNIKEGLSYDDVLIVPQYSNILSRSEISLESDLGQFLVNSPIISSPMDTVTEYDMAIAMSREGYLSIIHRYNSITDQVSIVNKAVIGGANIYYMAAAIGTGDEAMVRARALVDSGIKTICIDVAHGHHILVEKILRDMRENFGRDIHIIAGNIATKEGYIALTRWGSRQC